MNPLEHEPAVYLIANYIGKMPCKPAIPILLAAAQIVRALYSSIAQHLTGRRKKLYVCLVPAVLCFFSLLAMSSEAVAEDERALPAKESENTQAQPNLRQQLGNKYLGMAKAIDNFFSGRPVENEQNKSFLKTEIRLSKFDDYHKAYDFRIRAKLDLPRTKKRVRLFFDSDIQEENGLNQDFRSVATDEQLTKRDSVVGIEFGSDRTHKHLKPSLNLGAKFNSGLNPYIRLRLKNQYRPEKEKHIHFHQDFWYLKGQGWGESSHVEVRKNLSDQLAFSTISELEYRNKEADWEAGHRWILSLRQSDSYGIDYQLGHIEETDNNHLFDRHFFNINFRKRIYQRWLFVTLTPEIAYQYEDDWDSEVSITAKFEIFFTD